MKVHSSCSIPRAGQACRLIHPCLLFRQNVWTKEICLLWLNDTSFEEGMGALCSMLIFFGWLPFYPFWASVFYLLVNYSPHFALNCSKSEVKTRDLWAKRKMHRGHALSISLSLPLSAILDECKIKPTCSGWKAKGVKQYQAFVTNCIVSLAAWWD